MPVTTRKQLKQRKTYHKIYDASICENLNPDLIEEIHDADGELEGYMADIASRTGSRPNLWFDDDKYINLRLRRLIDLSLDPKASKLFKCHASTIMADEIVIWFALLFALPKWHAMLRIIYKKYQDFIHEVLTTPTSIIAFDDKLKVIAKYTNVLSCFTPPVRKQLNID